MTIRRFLDREDAGRRLAAELRAYASEHPIVLALPRGGVPVGLEIARELSAPLDVWVVRKVGAPSYPELGLGAVAEGGHVHLSQDMLDYLGLTDDALSGAIETKRREVEERVRKFRGDRPRPVLRDRTVIVVDDGIATGGTAHAVIESIRAEGPKAIVLAVPVAAPDAVRTLRPEVDRLVCLLVPENLFGISQWYEDFEQLADDEVVRLLDRARAERPEPERSASEAQSP
jgi:putative phosphoribosyl transferase